MEILNIDLLRSKIIFTLDAQFMQNII